MDLSPGRDTFQPADQLHPAANAEIIGRHDIEPPQVEDQENIGCPHADAGNIDQRLDHLFVG